MVFRILKNLCAYKFYSSFSKQSTIYALSSGQGKCGVAVIRVSGSQASTALKLVTRMDTIPNPRCAYLKNILNPFTGEVLDKGLVLWFPGPRSFTGEDSCELHVHGGIAVISAVLNVLGSIEDLRLAEPGEFTKRAFYNGKLDLTEVEGIADLLAAETEVQRKQALLQSQGYLSKLYNEWKKALANCLANLQAYIDFGETESLESDILHSVTEEIKRLVDNVTSHLCDNRRGERLRNGVRTVIIGEPNVGKSSLLNILCQRPAAIVTALEGTTRDLLEVTLDVGGYPIVLVDTAGLRAQTADLVEIEGITRALAAFDTADLVFLMVDSVKCLQWMEKTSKTFHDYLKYYLIQLNISDLLDKKKHCVVVANKIDLISESDKSKFKTSGVNLVSCLSESGITDLIKSVVEKLKILCGEPSKEHPSMTQMRHREHLTQCLKDLENFLSNIDGNADIGLLCEDIRRALVQIGKITGTVTAEDILDIIFKEFCIGK